ncbi:hypothetical protein PY310_15520 [Pseudarthrobacter sp. H3Y2-7]|uniref:hypothetical protein n=1 Tax=Pseudarthrobacter naphthalenicus TaxID=3031328 RepID=UPI0023B0BDA0|nr:hypothetical protein [Pseudarthrobacter sp. H3Y2-7]MDE8669990.1 hypothetical protein [Pseudarthrobacter sp. H3Y2-7]
MTCRRVPFRLLRTAAVAGSVLSLAVAAHLFGGGQLPPTPVLAACTALVVLCVMVLTRWKLKIPVLGAVLTGGQVFLHSLFSALSTVTPGGSASSGSVSGRHLHTSAGAGIPLPAAQNLDGYLPWDLEPAMGTAHLAATLVTAVLLAKGEAALWALAAWLRPILFLSPADFVHVTAAPAPSPRRFTILRRTMPRAHPRRGPPASA